jgi:predicted NBD/HSP70 family sugar kinase
MLGLLTSGDVSRIVYCMTSVRRRASAAAERAIVNVLRMHGPCTRAELTTLTGLSRATISSACAHLMATGQATADRSTEPSQVIGRIPEKVALSVRGAVVMGIEFGHRHVTVASVNEAHDIVATESRRCEADLSWPKRLRTALDVAKAQVIDPGRYVMAVGLGLPGRIRDRGRVVDLVTAGVQREICPITRVDNNARLAGLAESIWGAGRGLRSYVYLRLMDGVGGSLISEGHMYEGAHGLAGEFGHLTVNPEGPRCRCGKRGCLEAYASRERVLAATGTTSVEDLADALRRGNSQPVSAVRNIGRMVGVVLANACISLDVDGVVLGGDLLVLGDHLSAPLRDAFTENLMPSRPSTPVVRTSTIAQDDGALGGVALVLMDPSVEIVIPAFTTWHHRGGVHEGQQFAHRREGRSGQHDDLDLNGRKQLA